MSEQANLTAKDAEAIVQDIERAAEQHKPITLPAAPAAKWQSIDAALAAAQAEFPPIPKTKVARVKSKRTGAEYEYKYAGLDDCLTAVRPALSKHGLSLRHVYDLEGTIECVLTFYGAGGRETLSSGKLAMKPDEGDWQAFGSGLTYARRYSMQLVLGICPEDDDDAGRTPPGRSENPYREQQRDRGQRQQRQEPRRQQQGQRREQQPQQHMRPRVSEAIRACKTAPELASLLAEFVGKWPVSKHLEQWPRLLDMANAHIAAMRWPADQVRTIEAILAGVDRQLSEHAGGQQSPAEQEPAEAPPSGNVATSATSGGEITKLAMELANEVERRATSPDKLHEVIEEIAGRKEIRDKHAGDFAEVLKHAMGVLEFHIHKDLWTEADCEVVTKYLAGLSDLEEQSREVFGGSDGN